MYSLSGMAARRLLVRSCGGRARARARVCVRVCGRVCVRLRGPGAAVLTFLKPNAWATGGGANVAAPKTAAPAAASRPRRLGLAPAGGGGAVSSSARPLTLAPISPLTLGAHHHLAGCCRAAEAGCTGKRQRRAGRSHRGGGVLACSTLPRVWLELQSESWIGGAGLRLSSHDARLITSARAASVATPPLPAPCAPWPPGASPCAAAAVPPAAAEQWGARSVECTCVRLAPPHTLQRAAAQRHGGTKAHVSSRSSSSCSRRGSSGSPRQCAAAAARAAAARLVRRGGHHRRWQRACRIAGLAHLEAVGGAPGLS